MRGRVGGRIQTDDCPGALKTCVVVSLQRTQQTRPYLPNEPISSFGRGFPFRSLLGQRLLFATTLCSGKRSVQKCKASSQQQQLLCGKASLSALLWQFRKNPGSQGTWVRGTQGRGAQKPRIFLLLSTSLVSPQHPSPPRKRATQIPVISTNGWWWWWVEGPFLSLETLKRIQPPS